MSKIVLLEKYKDLERAQKDSIGLSPDSLAFKRFIKGPISLAWITRASKISSRAMSMGVLLWYWYGLTGSLTVRVSTKRLNEFGISRRTCFRALKDLEDAGLVHVDRKHGRAPLVRILINV